MHLLEMMLEFPLVFGRRGVLSIPDEVLDFDRPIECCPRPVHSMELPGRTDSSDDVLAELDETARRQPVLAD